MTTKTAPAAITIVTGYEQRNGQRTPVTAEVKVGDFLSESLVTDTLVYQVVKVTKATISIVPCQGTGRVIEDEACDKGANGLSVTWETVAPLEGSKARTLRVRKDQTVRMGNHVGARPLYPTTKVNGVPVQRRDWRF